MDLVSQLEWEGILGSVWKAGEWEQAKSILKNIADQSDYIGEFIIL